MAHGRWATAAVYLAALLSLAGCTHSYQPGPGMTVGDVRQAMGRCGLWSRSQGAGAGFGYWASGQSGFNAGTAARVPDSNDFDDCMLVAGAVQDGDARLNPPSVFVQPLGAASPSLRDAAQDRPVILPVPAAPLYAILAPPRPAGFAPVSLSNEPAQRPAVVEPGQGWLRATRVLDRGDRRSRNAYLALCGAGDQTACVMASTMRPM